MSDYTVRAIHCDHHASDEEIQQKLREITEPLERSWNQIEKARRILIKSNMIWPPDRIQYFHGRRRELVDDSVMRAVLQLLHERTDAEICMIDSTFGNPEDRPGPSLNYQPLLDKFGVRFIDANEPPFKLYEVPGGGIMFQRYQLQAEIEEADAFISVAKMKNHAFMGITLCLKNLFGLPPMPPHGRVRSYYHHIIRLSHVLPDLGLITRPCLNIIDGLVGQSGREWGGEGRIANALVAGDHVIATDACGAWLMGHQPAADWPNPPYKRDRNPLLVAAENGFGTVDLDEIDFETELTPPLAAFDSDEVDSKQTVRNWRQTTCEQALFYQEHCKELVEQYAGEYIFLQGGEVVWNGPDPSNLGSRRQLSGQQKDSALWLKKVDPEEVEGEQFKVYERILTSLTARETG